VEKAALSATIRPWSIESIGPSHLAIAAAGMMFMTIYGTSGADKLALPNVLQARHLAINMQLVNHDTAWKVYHLGLGHVHVPCVRLLLFRTDVAADSKRKLD
jgi:sulfite exporter TauE/SafE